MIDGGALIVTVARRGGGLRAVVDAPTPISLSRMMAGKPAAEAARLAGLMCDSCPLAHEAAARAAFGLPAPVGAEAEDMARAMALETLREHAFKFAVAWPRALGWPAADGVENPASAPDPRNDEAALLASAVFGDAGAPMRIADFERWMASGATPAARVLDHVWRRWDSRWGRAELPLWRAGARGQALDWREAEYDGAPFENSVAARVADADLMRAIEARRGRGLAWRLAARLVDSARLFDALSGGAPSEAPSALAPGVGVAQAAGGAVFAFAEMEDGRVRGFEQITPTDCALHPDGLLRLMLDTGVRRAAGPVAEIAAMTIEAVDPRAPTRLVMDGRERRAALH